MMVRPSRPPSTSWFQPAMYQVFFRKLAIFNLVARIVFRVGTQDPALLLLLDADSPGVSEARN
ncbi:hypothetical protein D3C84_986320 [compost metagenome]